MLLNESKRNISKWLHKWLQRPVAVLALAVALLLAGVWAALQVPLEWVPQVELPEVRISAAWPGGSPRQVERYIATPIERAVQTVPGTVSIESLSQEGTASIILGVSEDVDLSTYVAQVNERLALLRDVLPDRVHPRLTKKVPEALRDEQGFMTLQLVGPLTPDELRLLAEERMAPKLRSLPGLADILVEGGTQRELFISLDPDRLAAYDIEPNVVRNRLFEATRDGVYGRLRERGRALLLLSPSEERITALRHLVVNEPRDGEPPVFLEDVAEVALGAAPRYSISRIDGQSVVTLTLDRARASHMIDVAESVHERITTLRTDLPEGVRLLVADDRTDSVREQLRDLSWRGGLGLALVVLVLLFMLKGVRATIVVLFSVAVALAVAFALMGPLNLTLNLITLAGLVLVFGLLVDNSVVMVEQILLQRERLRLTGLSGLSLAGAATAAALQAVWLPLLGGTLSTIIVMLPLVYLSGELQTLFLPFGVLVSLTLMISLVSAVLLVPVLSRFLPLPEVQRHRRRWLRRIIAMPYRLVARFPRLSLAVLFLALGLPLWLLPHQIEEPREGWPEPVVRLARVYNETVGSERVDQAREVLDPALGGVLRPFIRKANFGPSWSYEPRPEVYVRLGFPPGNPIERADSLMQRFERIALASSSVERTIVRVLERSASMRVQFEPASLQTSEPYVMREKLIRQAVFLAGITVSVGGLLPEGYYSGIGTGISGLRVEAYGPNYEDLEALCERFAAHVRKRSRRVMGVNTNAGRYSYRSDQTREVLRFRWDAEAQARTGVTASWLSGTLRPVFATRFPVLYADLEGQTRMPVRIVMGGADDVDVARVMERPLALGDSSQVRLAGLASYRIEETPSGIERYNQQYKRYISIDYRGPGRMANEFLEAALESFSVPAGYHMERRSFQFFTEEVQEAFGWVFLATLFLVFLITAAVFESWKLPLVVMLSVPMAAIGVGLGFLWSEANFAEGAFIGVVLLVGIAVNDSILLTDRYRQLRQLRPTTSSALLARLAVRERLRPMWTTTLTSVVAMLPLLVFPDGGDFWIGLAVTVVGGLLASTLLAPLASVAMLSMQRRS
ncbi:MAG: efflux RND transporter permease subunit [Rhodothermales bacterium]